MAKLKKKKKKPGPKEERLILENLEETLDALLKKTSQEKKKDSP